jgi:two-component system sensor histidine kinase BaeS
VRGKPVYVEGRPTTDGGIVLVQRRADAQALDDAAVRRIVLALVIAGAVAAAIGLLVAWRLALPLRRTARAAHALAAGQRDVQVMPEGPAEVADVAQAVNGLSAALTRSEARQREFLLSVSHDLRTPLTAITGYAESLADGVVEPGQATAVGSVMLAEARRLDRLVADLLDLARLDADDFRLDIAPVDVADVVRGAAPVWADRCAAEGVPFRVEYPPHPLPTLTDAARLRQVLDGLLENALRVTPAAAPIVLAARAEPGPGGASLVAAEVRDGGPGLTDADVAVAFERGELFRRYRGVRQVGTGLGLAIVHRLVARLGGTIEAGRAPEGGARFTVRLPGDRGVLTRL